MEKPVQVGVKWETLTTSLQRFKTRGHTYVGWESPVKLTKVEREWKGEKSEEET